MRITDPEVHGSLVLNLFVCRTSLRRKTQRRITQMASVYYSVRTRPNSALAAVLPGYTSPLPAEETLLP